MGSSLVRQADGKLKKFFEILESTPFNHCNRDWYAMGVKVDFPSGEIILILLAAMHFVHCFSGLMAYIFPSQVLPR